MKKLLSLALSLLLFSFIFSWTSCKKTDDPTWSDEDKASYEEVISLQDEVSNKLDEWFLSMDSLDAIDMAHQSFSSEASVSSAVISSQGITVQYANGMRGGLFIDPRDGGATEKSFESLIDGLNSIDSESLKSLVNKRKMILLNPHYYERAYYTDILINSAVINLERAGMTVFRNRNEGSSVDAFTQLADYGIIQVYSHGCAWPNEKNITDVYLLTGETTNEATSKKYWDELKTGNIPIMKIGSSNKYFISERFISEYNDFSQDTTLFYGGFCYSFLGDWPDITESFADGAYFGFDWSVRTSWNAAWAQNLIKLMSDTSMLAPMGPEAWMNDSDMAKSYLDSQDERTVHIYYTGDGNLTLWDDTGVNLIALSDDGAPVSTPGEAGVQYPFRCDVVSNITDIEYSWDIGDGGSPVIASNAVYITWAESGNYLLKVSAINKNDGSLIGTASLNVVIGEIETGIVAFMKTCDFALVELDCPNTLSNYPYSGISWRIEEGDLSWSGLSFSGTSTGANGGVSSIEGTLSGDGQKISFTVNKNSTSILDNIHVKVMMTVVDYPLYEYIPPGMFGGQSEYKVDPPGDISYVTGFSAEVTLDNNTTYITMADFDWTKIDELFAMFHKDTKNHSRVKVMNE